MLRQLAWHKTIAASISAVVTNTTRPVIEFREYDLIPEHASSYMQATADASDLRKSLVPLRFFSLPETGGQLLVATHAYYYGGGYSERDTKRAIQAKDEKWRDYLLRCRPFVHGQRSTIWTEAPFLSDMIKEYDNVRGLANNPETTSVVNDSNCVLEIRRYKLKLGYDTVPQFMNLYQTGLPSKLNAPGTDPSTSLVTVMYTEVGRLNEVIELWRHGNGTVGMETSRLAGRSASEWRNAIAKIADKLAIEFTSTIHKPAAFSPIR